MGASYPTAVASIAVDKHAVYPATVQQIVDEIVAAQTRLGVSGASYTPNRAIIRANATRTFTSDTNLQAMFTTPAGGALTAAIGTYLFGGIIKLNTLDATSGNFLVNILGAGTATTAAWLWHAHGIDATDPTAAAAQTGTFAVTSASVASVVTAATGTGAAVELSGTFEVTVAGTIIPSLDQVTAAAAVLEIGSYLWFEYVDPSVAVTSIGAWA